MAEFLRHADERLIGSGRVSLKQRQGLFWGMFHGDLYVTDQRVCFHMKMTGSTVMELLLQEIQGFMAGYSFFLTAVRIYSREGKEYKITGMLAKEVGEWLLEAGVLRLEEAPKAGS